VEQQLDQTIESMNGISSAQVELAIPDPTATLFTGSNTQASGSVLLNTNTALSSTAVKAIAQEVAGAVSGLNVDRVTITDQDGDLLWPDNTGAGASALTAAQSADNAYDTQKAEAADAYLAATVGPGKALVMVSAVLNTNQQTVSSVNYAKKGTPLSSSVTTETLTGTGATPTAAGTTATQVASVAGSTNNGNSNYKSTTSNTTLGVDKTVSQSTIAPGTLTRQSISVLVNKNVPASEVPAIEKAVENSLGYVSGRDSISTGSVAFPALTPAGGSSPTSAMMGDVKYVVIGLGAMAFLFFMRRGLRRSESEQFAGSPTWLRELEAPRSLSELEERSRMVELETGTVNVARLRSPVNVARQQVEELVDRDPQRVAAQVRQWMSED
jgi:flagellar M-ring protein FliF